MPAFVHTGKCDGFCKGDAVATYMCVGLMNHKREFFVGLSIVHDCDRGGLYVR